MKQAIKDFTIENPFMSEGGLTESSIDYEIKFTASRNLTKEEISEALKFIVDMATVSVEPINKEMTKEDWNDIANGRD